MANWDTISKTFRFLAAALITLCPCFVTAALAQTQIQCGKVINGSIDVPDKEVRYTFNANAGDVVTLRIVSTSRAFSAQMQLINPGNQSLESSSSQITRGLIQTGVYTILVKYISGSSRTGNYSLSWQRTKNPCNPMQIASCQTTRASIENPAEIDAYVFNGTAGQTAVLLLQGATTNLSLSSNVELYDPDGNLMTAPSPLIRQLLPKTGVYTVFVSTDLFSGMTGNYALSLANIAVHLSTPNGGEVFLPGSDMTINWESFGDDPAVASQDILLSTDGGVSFPLVVAAGLPAKSHLLKWNIPPDLNTSKGRLRVTAKDSAGTVCSDDSDADFTILAPPSSLAVTYKYDELNRLIQVLYDDGSTINYTYDAAGNRLNEVAVVGNNRAPAISGASVERKRLTVQGQKFDDGAKVLLNGEQQKTVNDDQNPSSTLIAPKAGKKIVVGETVRLQARNSNGLVSPEFNFIRTGGDCTFSLSPSSQNFGAGAGNGSVKLTGPGGCNWIASSNASWIAITSGTSGSGSGTVVYSVTVNAGEGWRAGTVTIAGQLFTVAQTGATGDCSFSLIPTSQSIVADGTNIGASVLGPSGCSWKAVSNVPWISIVLGNVGSGNGSVIYTAAANTAASSRTGTLTIAGQTLTVTQDGGSACRLSISPSSGSFGNGLASGTVTITQSSAPCAWIASSNASWIVITSGDSGFGTGVLTFLMAANPSSSSRTGTITVANQTFTVTQSGTSSSSVVRSASELGQP